MNDHQDEYQEQLHDFLSHCGFKATHADSEHGGKIIHLHHPLLHLDFEFAEPRADAPIPQETLQALAAISAAYDVKVEEQNALVDHLNAQGWDMTTTKADYSEAIYSAGKNTELKHTYEKLGTEGKLTFLYQGADLRAKGKVFTLPTHEEYCIDVFDTELAKQAIASILGPQAVVVDAQHLGSGAPAKLPFADQQDRMMSQHRDGPALRS